MRRGTPGSTPATRRPAPPWRRGSRLPNIWSRSPSSPGCRSGRPRSTHLRVQMRQVPPEEPSDRARFSVAPAPSRRGRRPLTSDSALHTLLRRELVREEEPGTRALIERLRHVKRVGEFTRAEFLAMCRWKSPRAAALYAENRSAAVRSVSRAVLATRSERRRLELLTTLRGVS